MLTATYSLVAIAAEQDRARGLLSQLQRYIHSAWKGLQGFDFHFLEITFGKLVRLDTYWRARKIETYLIPALRPIGREAESLIAELDALAEGCAEIVGNVGSQLAALPSDATRSMSEALQAMEVYCSRLFTRFDKEETILLPLARRLLSVEEWFAMAARFLSDGSARQERRRQPASPLRVHEGGAPAGTDAR